MGKLDAISGVPRFVIIRETLLERIGSGVYADERRLPPIEKLAEEFGVNRHTALQAVRDLAREGIVELARGRGTTITRGASRISEKTVLLDPRLKRIFPSRAWAWLFEKYPAAGFAARSDKADIIVLIGSLAAQSADVVLDLRALGGPKLLAERGVDRKAAAAFDCQGKLLALPLAASPLGMAINLDHLKAAGLRRPSHDWNWDDFREVLSALAAAGPRMGRRDFRPFAHSANVNRWMSFIWQAGGHLIETGDRLKIRANDPLTLRGLRLFGDLLRDRRTTYTNEEAGDPKLDVYDQAHGAFFEGRCAMTIVGLNCLPRAGRRTPASWDIVPLPRDLARASALTVDGVGIRKTCVRTELAWRLMGAFLSEEFQRFLSVDGTNFPVNRNAITPCESMDARQRALWEQWPISRTDYNMLGPAIQGLILRNLDRYWRGLEALEPVAERLQIALEAACVATTESASPWIQKE
jgi:ABC-type glycerol-3-phosphate transport system substrate-binding protein/DNA-binding transcriptional regulator YhcF (GntR family)